MPSVSKMAVEVINQTGSPLPHESSVRLHNFHWRAYAPPGSMHSGHATMKRICPSMHEIPSRVQRSLAHAHAPHASMSKTCSSMTKIHARIKLAGSPLHVCHASMDRPVSIDEPLLRSLAEMRARQQRRHARQQDSCTPFPAGAEVPASFRFHLQRCRPCEHAVVSAAPLLAGIHFLLAGCGHLPALLSQAKRGTEQFSFQTRNSSDPILANSCVRARGR